MLTTFGIIYLATSFSVILILFLLGRKDMRGYPDTTRFYIDSSVLLICFPVTFLMALYLVVKEEFERCK